LQYAITILQYAIGVKRILHTALQPHSQSDRNPRKIQRPRLKGAYEFQLYWTPRGLLQNNAKITDAAPTPIDELTLFEAVDKQLGLKIEEQKHPIPVVVIDKVDRTPTQN